MFSAIKRLLPSQIKKLLGAIKQAAKKQVWRVYLRWLVSLQWRSNRSGLDHEIHEVDPLEIVYRTEPEFSIYKDKGRVVGGNWDRLEYKFADLDIYQSFKQRLDTGTDWCDLPIYKRVLSEVEQGHVKWGVTSREELDTRYAKLDEIFEDIRENGYRSQESLGKTGSKHLLDYEDEVTVNIGRHGDLLFNNGRHRLTMAKLAGVEKLKVKITGRHKEWEMFKREIWGYARRHGGKVYAPLRHIDLENISSTHGHERFELIRGNLSIKKGRLLDIGAHWGYFCHRFEEVGFDCEAIESSEENTYFLQKLQRSRNRRFNVVNTSIFELGNGEMLQYDVVLALSIFHHFIKQKSTMKAFKALLNRLEIREMFFEPHCSTEPQMQGAFFNPEPEEFINFIIDNSNLKNYCEIGICDNDRPIYRLWADVPAKLSNKHDSILSAEL